MFNIGDKVVYPMHGAGVIESIEEKEILGDRKKYYVMNMPVGDIKVMIPLDNVERIGLRDVIGKGALEEVFEILENMEEITNPNWNRRYRANMDKIKSGNIFKVAEVVRTLLLRERRKGLSSGERKMLESAKQILMSELLMVKGIDRNEIVSYLERLFNHQNDEDSADGETN
ncbi:MAG TPA: CarD family transcriptional regulator [Firmicutes bacterium]|jgi:CarD family transcriptional regulator|nr:CarD family transcriptional regulator [Bacillota bacterium]